MPSSSYLSQEAFAELVFGIRDYVENPKNAKILDRSVMPWHSMLQKMKKTVPFVNNQITIIYKEEADQLNMQTWQYKDRLNFQEFRTGFSLSHSGVQVHMGLRFWHQELKDQGYIILPNGPRSQNFAAKISKVEGLRLFDTLKEKFESAYDRWDVLIDQKFLHNVSGLTTEPIALTDIISKTPTVGTYGGRDRSDPKMQNIAVLNSTAASFERDMNSIFRRSILYSRGYKGANINVIMASSGWIDRYASALKDSSNGFRMNTDVKKPGPIDIGIGDTQWAFNGVPVVYNPTMDFMATLTGDATWNRRAYPIATSTFTWGCGEKEDKYLSAPLDPSDQRRTDFSIDGRYSLYCENLRANAVHEFAS